MEFQSTRGAGLLQRTDIADVLAALWKTTLVLEGAANPGGTADYVHGYRDALVHLGTAFGLTASEPAAANVLIGGVFLGVQRPDPKSYPAW